MFREKVGRNNGIQGDFKGDRREGRKREEKGRGKGRKWEKQGRQSKKGKV